MKKWLLVTAAVMLAVGLLLGSAFAALAQGGDPPQAFGGLGLMGRGMMGNRYAYTGTVPFGRGGMMGNWANRPFTGTLSYGPMSDVIMGAEGVHEQVWTGIAKTLGLSYDQLQTELKTKTLAQLAQEKNVTLETLQSVATGITKSGLNQLVEQGELTREQADAMLQRMDVMGNGMFGAGRCGGQCGAFGAPQNQGTPQTPRGRGGMMRGGRMGRQS